ncbi:MAG: hypothetical protein Q7S77_02095 [Candidatus Staskawiczbacteria bacterium]|nr:hypothetical protein [Candidatus Staskawiczbacteria bacterium]
MNIIDEDDIDNDNNAIVDLNLDPDPEITLVSVDGHYGILDWRGFHPSPKSSLAEEIRRDPIAAMNNRFSRAKKLKSQGCEKMAKKLLAEAYKIKNIVANQSIFQNQKNSKTKPRFSH